MVKKTGISRDFIIHPGETLKEVLDDREITQRELALRTNVTEPHVSAIIKGRKALSVSFAKKLEYALSIDASFWINLQANYEKELADYEEYNHISGDELAILSRLKDVIAYMKSRKLIDPQAEGSMLVIELRKLLQISDLTRIPEISQSGAYRLSSSYNVDTFVLFTWLRVADLVANAQDEKPSLNVNHLKKILPYLRSLTSYDTRTIHKELRASLADCGIRFAVVMHVTGAPVQGVIKRNGDGTISLIMTLRRKFADIFWFTFFHEIGHLLHNDIKHLLIDYEGVLDEMEARADRFAADLLLPLSSYDSFVEEADFSLSAIKRLCEALDIPVFILIGRLQRDGHIAYSMFQEYKISYEFEDMELL